VLGSTSPPSPIDYWKTNK